MDLSDWIDRHAGLTPDKTAIRFPGRDLSYAALAALIERQAAALAAHGVGRGGCVAYLGYNSPEMLSLLFACARLGALYMPLNWRLAAAEHRQMLDDCPPAVLFVETPFVAQTEGLREGLAGTTLVAFDDAPTGWMPYPDFLASAGNEVRADPEVGPHSPVLICYTSGSTGKPKGVVLTQDALIWNAANSSDMHELSAEDRILTTLPLFHVGGLNNQTTPGLAAGCTVVLHPRFDPEATLDAIERERITLTVLVPAQIDILVAHPRWRTADLSSLHMITTGSTIVPERIIHLVLDRGVPLIQVYGSTETCPIAVYQKIGDARRKAGSAGRVARHCELRIQRESGAEAPAGETGEILIRGPNVMCGYWNAPEATAAVLVDGWFHTGDMGHLDAEGYLWVDGRKKDLIISGGENIYPAEVENVIIECDGVAEVSVVGRPDPRWGEIVVAVIVPAPGCTVTAEAVMAVLDGRVARYKHPKEMVFVEALPKTALGKVRKEEVRRLVAHHARSGFGFATAEAGGT
ncbi:MAG: long-chain fatty acid--CoA ligase [Rhodocyclaceae bacterium]|nr:long-chain fatty acid--CoA ligase [Rhodocyclaceae bacterium]